jgi:hypothetical protein
MRNKLTDAGALIQQRIAEQRRAYQVAMKRSRGALQWDSEVNAPATKPLLGCSGGI